MSNYDIEGLDPAYYYSGYPHTSHFQQELCYLFFMRLSGGFLHFLTFLLAILMFLNSLTVLLFTLLCRTRAVKELIKDFIHLGGTKLSLPSWQQRVKESALH